MQLGADSPEHRFSRHLRDLVAQCLQKDPKKRPSAKALLEHRFFKEKAGKPDFLVKMLLEGIPPLGERVRELRERENARRGAAAQSDIKSQSQCVRCCYGSLLALLTPPSSAGTCVALATGIST